MSFSQLSLNSKLLPKCPIITHSWIAEQKSRFTQNVNLISIMQLSTLIPPHISIVDVRSIPAQILEDGEGSSVALLGENQTMPVAYRWGVDDPIALGMST